jgi:hypothetical protein
MLGQPVYDADPDVVGFELTGRCARAHRHRPGADRHRDAAQARGGRQVRRVLRRGHSPAWRCPTAPPSPTWRPSTARPWASSRSTRRPSTTCARAPAAPRPRSRLRGLLQGAGPVGVPRRARSTTPGGQARPGRRQPSLAGPKRPQDRIELGVETPVHELFSASRRAENGFAKKPAAGRAAEDRQRLRRPSTSGRRRADRRDHQLHQHQQPRRAARRRPAGQEGGRGGPEGASPGSRPRWPRARRSSPTTSRRPACCPTSRSSASTWSATAAPPASATPATSPEINEAITENDLVVRRGALGQPQLRGAHPPQPEGQLPGQPAAGGGLRHRRQRDGRPDDASRRASWRCSATRSPPTTSRRPARIKESSPAGRWLIGARRWQGRLQQLRLAPRQPRGDDARHLRQRAHQEPDDPAEGRRQPRGRRPHPLHQPSGRRRCRSTTRP